MLSKPLQPPASSRQAGFNLVELMVALAVGLVVSFAVISFIAAMMNANSETIQSTRLNQELRAISEIVSRELRRARALDDPISNIGQGSGAVIGTWSDIDTATAGCAKFGYEGAQDGDFRVVRRAVVGGVGRVVLARGAAAINCATAGAAINSALVDVTALEFTEVGADRVDVRVEGRLVSDPDDIRRDFRSTVFVRSRSI